jgi:hypothetical protein
MAMLRPWPSAAPAITTALSASAAITNPLRFMAGVLIPKFARLCGAL